MKTTEYLMEECCKAYVDYIHAMSYSDPRMEEKRLHFEAMKQNVIDAKEGESREENFLDYRAILEESLQDQVPVAWISTVQSFHDPVEFDVVAVVGDSPPDNGGKWTPLYTRPQYALLSSKIPLSVCEDNADRLYCTSVAKGCSCLTKERRIQAILAEKPVLKNVNADENDESATLPMPEHYVTLTPELLREVLQFSNTDGAEDLNQSQTPTSIGYAQDGHLYCWLAEYPEEGCIKLEEIPF